MKTPSEKTKKLIRAIAFIAIGLVFILVPDTALAWALRAVGALLLVYEAYEIYGIYMAYKESDALVFVLLNEALPTLLSVMLLINPIGAIRLVGLTIGLYFLIRGGIGLYRNSGARDKRSLVAYALLVLAGLLLLILPYALAEALTLLIGIALVLYGAWLLIPLFNGRGGKKRNNDDENYYM